MEALQDFAQKDMIEQITLLDEIREGRKVEALPHLMELYTHPTADQAVNEMVYHTLYDLLAGRDREIIDGLGHQSPAIRMLCVRRAAEDGCRAALPVLLDLLADPAADSEFCSEVIRALENFQDPSLLGALLPFLKHENYSVVAWAMRVLAGIGDPAVRDALLELVAESDEMRDPAAACDLRTALAVENLARFVDDRTVAFLCGHIHHANPSFRRVVISALVSMGPAVLAALEGVLEQGDKDEKIMAANIIGLIGDRQGADILVARLDQEDEANLKFAIYEALGRINSIRSVIGLADGLAEEDELALIAVITAMNNLCNPGIVKVVNDCLDKRDQQAGRVIDAIVTTRSTLLFTAVYRDMHHADTLVAALLKGADHEALEVFRKTLLEIDTENSRADAGRLAAVERQGTEKRILAADDSKAMLFFYKGIAKELGVDLVTVEDGRQALDVLRADAGFDLVITDMNMPNMDGVELTRELRKMEGLRDLPVLMATTESEQSQSEAARAAGVTDFITKPFTKEDFKKKLSRLL